MSRGREDLDAALRRTIGDAYVIERELDGGGMSRVYLALERALNRHVVVKVLPPDVAAGVNRERFEREIQVAAQLQHPHIVPLHSAGAREELLYFTMPYIAGDSLRRALLDGHRFSVREVIGILHDVADALAYAHARGVIHRDIKPGNVLRSGAHAVVTDFGVAKAISAARGTSATTSSGIAIGTPAYMAPEQLAGDPAADHRVDIYALGLLGYELLSGKVPFLAASPQETMAAQLTRAPAALQRRDMPPGLETLINRCLAKIPDARPQSASEVVAELDRLDAAVARPSRTRPARSALAAAGVVLSVVAGVTSWVLLQKPTRSAPAPVVVAINDAPVTHVVGTLLTPEDSLAIAEAVQRKMRERQPAAVPRQGVQGTEGANSTNPHIRGTPADSFRIVVQNAVLDSVLRVRGVPAAVLGGVYTAGDSTGLTPGTGAWVVQRPRVGGRRVAELPSPDEMDGRRARMGPPRRVFVSPAPADTNGTTLQASVDSLVDSVRRTIASVDRFQPLTAEAVRAARTAMHSDSAIATALDVDLFVSVEAHVLVPPTSVLWRITIRDLSAHPAFSSRVVVERAPRDALLARADSLATYTLRFLESVDRAPRVTAGRDDD